MSVQAHVFGLHYGWLGSEGDKLAMVWGARHYDYRDASGRQYGYFTIKDDPTIDIDQVEDCIYDDPSINDLIAHVKADHEFEWIE